MDGYELLDFGDGRRLERFGPWILDRPCPAAEAIPKAWPDRWAEADARFERSDSRATSEEQGDWIVRSPNMPDRWSIVHDGFQLELKRSPFGHIGVFAEQASNWDWIAQQAEKADRPLTVLNLFAYTGGSTLAVAAAGAEVVHVDAARNTVAWARRNAELSGMSDAPIRWIAEDALKFVRREIKRGNGYDAVILDPPSYGHGRRGEVWRLSTHLEPLLRGCVELTAGRRRFLLLTCHTPGYDAKQLDVILNQALAADRENAQRGKTRAASMAIRTATGRELPSGAGVRWSLS